VRTLFPFVPVLIFENLNKPLITGQSHYFEWQDVLIPSRWFAASAYVPRPGYLTELFWDITERKNAEAALKESEERLRLAHEGAHIGTFDWNIQTGENIWSPQLEVMYGLLPGSFASTQPAWESLVYPDDRAQAVQLVEHTLKTGEPVDGEWRVQWPDGSLHWISGRFQAFKDSSGKPVRMSGINMDITERKLAEESLKKYTKDLENANKDLEAFGYSVTHDMKQPLRALGSYSELLYEDYKDRLGETGKDYVERIKKASFFLSELTEDMLKLSRITRAEMIREPVDLSAIAKATINEFKANQPSRQVDIKIAPDLMANGDQPLLHIALRNLIENAWKFTLKSQIAHIELGSLEKDGERVYFIKDNGIGFDMKYQDKLFQPFQRLTTDKDYPGTGIGLAIVQRVIRRHGGEIWAEAEPGKVTTFYFTVG
jgi:PAS domain S-box-containing protein